MQKSKKIVILGHFGVGKTSLIRRFVLDQFSDTYKVTIGVHITKKEVILSPDDIISLIIWDLEGTDDLEQIRSAYLLGTHGILFVFDVNRPSTFQHLAADLDSITKKIPDKPLLVVGNKMDLVSENEIAKELKHQGIHCDYLTSAKTGNKVEDVFIELANLLNNEA